MRYVAAALLLSMAGGDINKNNIKKILGSVGVECEDDKVQLVIDQIKGKDVESLLAEGLNKLGSVPTGGAGGMGAPVPAGDGAPAAAAAAEPAKEEKKDEPSDESDDDMGFGLFD